MAIIQQIEQIYKDTGQLITVEIKGRIEGDPGLEVRQPSTTTSVYSSVESVETVQRNGVDARLVKFFISNANAYKPQIADKVIIGGVSYNISSVSEDILGSEIISYTCEGVG